MSEVCFPVPRGHTAGTPDPKAEGARTGATGGGDPEPDLAYVEAILQLIESRGIPAPAPIEQRWTCGSRSPLSPASVAKGEGIQDALSSWVSVYSDM